MTMMQRWRFSCGLAPRGGRQGADVAPPLLVSGRRAPGESSLSALEMKNFNLKNEKNEKKKINREIHWSKREGEREGEVQTGKREREGDKRERREGEV